MNVVYCVFKNLDEGADALLWVCSSWEAAERHVKQYGYPGENYYIKEEIVED